MTDKELAEEYAREWLYHVKELELHHKEDDKPEYIRIKQAFLAGLKAGRPQWHDLRKDPNDLPEKYIPVLNQYGEHRSYDGHFWRDCDDVIYTDVIAWCEIPQFKE